MHQPCTELFPSCTELFPSCTELSPSCTELFSFSSCFFLSCMCFCTMGVRFIKSCIFCVPLLGNGVPLTSRPASYFFVRTINKCTGSFIFTDYYACIAPESSNMFVIKFTIIKFIYKQSSI